MTNKKNPSTQGGETIKLFLCGDVMAGRGIDQVLPYASDPQLYESYVRNAKEYVNIAERANGPIPKPVEFSYIWGDAIDEFQRQGPDVRIINLETSITTNKDHWPEKGINYRMHPKNSACLTAADIDCCALANNHVLDWDYAGLIETLHTLRNKYIKFAGAGGNLTEASTPAVMDVEDKGRVIVYSFALESSGVPRKWAAKHDKPGVNLLTDLSHKTIKRIAGEVTTVKRTGDIVVASVHWGGNWGYHIPGNHSQFAHELVDFAGVDIVHGHSSHHPLAIDVYKDKPILYGCGDFINDYEGISGYEQFRDDLTLMYFVRMAPQTAKVMSLEMVPMQIRRFKLNRASAKDSQWLQATLDRECGIFSCGVELTNENTLRLQW